MLSRTLLRPLFALLLLTACQPAAQGEAETAIVPFGPPGVVASRFPRPERPVAPVVSDRWRGEDERERLGETARVLAALEVRPGMTVADIGAGSGYYTPRLSAAVGPGGRVLAQDITPATLNGLRRRVLREGLSNVSVGLGQTGDPRLPRASTDVALLIHMYHEIGQPFALMANLVPALRPGARIGIVDVDDAIENHGTPRALLLCEMTALGYRQVAFQWLLEQPPRSEYLAIFAPPASPPAPEGIRACRL